MTDSSEGEPRVNALPASFADPDVIVAHDQEVFASVGRMVNHWDSPGWTHGRRSYYWYLTFDEPALAAAAAALQRPLAGFDLDQVPLDGLHLTLAKLGALEDVGADRLAAAIGAARDACGAAEPFTLTAVPLAGSSDTVRYSVAPWEPLYGLRRALPDADPDAVFRPHISIAYSNRPGPARPLIDAVRDLRAAEPVQVSVRELQLVELRREQRTYRWDVVETVALGR